VAEQLHLSAHTVVCNHSVNSTQILTHWFHKITLQWFTISTTHYTH